MNVDGSLSYGRWDLLHAEYLEARAVRPDVADARHYTSIEGATDPRWNELPHTFGRTKRHPGLVIPTFGPDGRVNGVQVRYDTPRADADGDLKRYANPALIPAKRLDIHPFSQAHLKSAEYPLFVTEGIAKADSLVSHGAVAVGITGVGTWNCADWDHIELKDRHVYVVFDSDYATNKDVSRERIKLARFLHDRGAYVLLTDIPPTDSDDPQKQGVDDWLATFEPRFQANDRLGDLHAMSTRFVPPPSKMTFTPLSEVDDDPASFLIRDLLLQRETCVVAGAEKTMKSWVAAAMIVAVASGRPLFGATQYEVFKHGVVVVITGEGKARLLRRRIKSLCEALSIEMSDIENQIIVTDDIVPITSDDFTDSVESVVTQYNPVLVVLDPLYTFVGGNVDAANVFGMGPVYARARDSVGDRALVIVTHFNKSGRDTLELNSITQAGGREFAPSWWLMAHSREPEPNEQRYGLRVVTGGREGFGSEFGLDVQLPKIETASDGEITFVGTTKFDVVPVSAVGDEINMRREILQWLQDAPFTMTKNDIKGSGDGVQARTKAMAWLEKHGVVRKERLPGPNGERKADRWGPVFLEVDDLETAVAMAEQHKVNL